MTDRIEPTILPGKQLIGVERHHLEILHKDVSLDLNVNQLIDHD
jgi:hypothetical protein